MIVETNDLDAVKATQYSSLCHMLDGGRFEAFPWGVHEPWYELGRYPELALTVDDNLTLSYTSPFYFFVSKNNPDLARNLECACREALLMAASKTILSTVQPSKTSYSKQIYRAVMSLSCTIQRRRRSRPLTTVRYGSIHFSSSALSVPG